MADSLTHAEPIGTPITHAEPIGTVIARARTDRGLTQDRLAERLCEAAGLATLTRHEVSRWERGERIPGGHWRIWLSHVLAVPLARLDRAAAAARRCPRAAAVLGGLARYQPPPVPQWPPDAGCQQDARWWQEQPGVYARIGGPLPSMGEPS